MEQNNEMTQMSNSMLATERNRIQQLLDTIYDNIVVNQDKAKIPDVVFRDYFLDFFKHSNEERYKDSDLLSKWIDLAGGPYQEVSVFNSKGEVVFDVPALYTNRAVNLNILKDADVDFNRIGINHKHASNISTERGDNYLATELQALPRFINNIDNDMETTKRWLDIFKYYEEESNDFVDTKLNQAATNIPQDVKEKLGLVFLDDED